MNDDANFVHCLLVQLCSSNPQDLQQASTAVENILNDDQNTTLNFYRCLSKLLCSRSNLDDKKMLVGLIHLKNFLMKYRSQEIISLDQGVIRDNLLSLLEDNNNPDRNSNNIEYSYSFSKILIDVFTKLFKIEWTIGVWPFDAWKSLFNYNAWLILKHCIKEASLFRIPRRMKLLFDVLLQLYPALAEKFLLIMQSDNLELEYARLGTCKVLTNIFMCCPQKSGAILLDNDKHMWQTLLEISVTYIKTHIQTHPSLGKSLAKLTYVLVTASSLQLLSPSVLSILQCIISLICEDNTKINHNTSKILLSLVQKILEVRRQITPAVQSIHHPLSISQEIHQWLTENDNMVLRKYINVLMEVYMKLNMEKSSLYLNTPEACLSAGGVMTSSGEQFSTDILWYPDGVTSTTNLQTTDLTLSSNSSRSSSVKLIPATSCCQLAESQLVLFARYYSTIPLYIEHIKELYPENIELEMSQDLFLRREVLLRALQMLIKIFQYRAQSQSSSLGADNQNALNSSEVEGFLKMITRILELEQITGENLLSSLASAVRNCSDDTDQIASLFLSDFNKAALICYCRSILLLSRYVIYAPNFQEISYQNTDANMVEVCKNAIRRLQQVMNSMSSPEELALLPNSIKFGPLLAIRLCAARSICWICDHVLFPDSVLSEGSQIQLLMEDTMKIIEITQESETKMHLLKMICVLLDFMDPLNVNSVTNSLLNLLTRLWNLGEDAPLRGGVIDTLASLVMHFKVGHERQDLNDEFMNELQDIVVNLINTAIFQEELFENVLQLWFNLFNPWSMVIKPHLVKHLCDMLFLQLIPRQGQPHTIISRAGTLVEICLIINISSLVLLYIVNTKIVDADTRLSFLVTYTEPFWAQIYQGWTPQHRNGRCEMDKNSWTSHFDELCLVYRPDLSQLITDDSDEERKFRSSQLLLLSEWLTVFLDQFVSANRIASDPQLTNSDMPLSISNRTNQFLLINTSSNEASRALCQISPSLLANVVILIQEPFLKTLGSKRLTQRLVTMSRFGLYRETCSLLPFLIHLSKICQHDPESINQGLNMIQILSYLQAYSEGNTFPGCDTEGNLSPILTIDYTCQVIKEWTDSLNYSLQTSERHSLIIAVLKMFVYGTQIIKESNLNSQDYFNTCLENVFNKCVQTLLFNRRNSQALDFSFGPMNLDPIDEYPTGIQTLTQVIQQIHSSLNDWSVILGEDEVADKILSEYLDSSIKNKLQWVLTAPLDASPDEIIDESSPSHQTNGSIANSDSMIN